MRFKDKTILVVGGSSGIGLACAMKLAQEGARIVIVSNAKEDLKQAMDALPGDDHITFYYDLSISENIQEIFDFLEAAHILLDGMVFSAGIAPLCLIKDNSVDQMERIFRINYFSFIELVKFFQRETNSREGSKIVAVSSVTSRGAGYRQTLYGASKAALNASVKLMAKELLNRNIHVNCISPGVTDTAIVDELRSQSMNFDENLKKTQPLGPIPPDRVADAIVYLMSDGSDYLTGAEWVLDAGLLLK
jgi:NAD(P)-dependent dehydrogenase (short-subunit alcohol dehydrogenase family)